MTPTFPGLTFVPDALLGTLSQLTGPLVSPDQLETVLFMTVSDFAFNAMKISPGSAPSVTYAWLKLIIAAFTSEISIYAKPVMMAFL